MDASPELNQKITEILASLPPRTPRSRLEPYRELIREMRRRGRTYREIAGVLGERCGVRVAASSVHEFVRRRSRARPAPATETALPTFFAPAATAVQEPHIIASRAEPSPDPVLDPDGLRQRIEALKQRPATVAAAGLTKPLFTYNENEPLRVGKAGGR